VTLLLIFGFGIVGSDEKRFTYLGNSSKKRQLEKETIID
jgi:hypothetical protein